MSDYNKGLSEEIRKIKYRATYKVNESPKYRSLIDDGEEFDEIPKLTTEADGVEDNKSNDAPAPPVESNPVPSEVPSPAFDAPDKGEELTPDNPDDNINTPEPQVDNIQNDIIKHNIEALKNIHDRMESLNNIVMNLNSKVESLSSDVEEVREPSDGEKLMSKKEVSYPYYFNLNDFWKGNWFNQSHENEVSKGIRELPDGTFVADFDDLPQNSKTDIQNSFNGLM